MQQAKAPDTTGNPHHQASTCEDAPPAKSMWSTVLANIPKFNNPETPPAKKYFARTGPPATPATLVPDASNSSVIIATRR